MKYLIILFLSVICCLQSANWYFFWLKSADNTITNIQHIEGKYQLHLPIISFIFDPRGNDAIKTITNLSGQLGEDRIYHITISPDNFSAQEVAEGKFDKQYKTFFDLIKANNVRVIFRTMHEMNGGRYPRSSNPANFKKARIHVRNLSREAWLNAENILFDMSVNHRDMPTKDPHPSQTSKLITCSLSTKEKKQCATFEDYYPGDKYVDLMGFTFYNRGKASYDRSWIAPTQIVNQRDILSRLKSFSKPIFIDEVATTAVRYDGKYNAKQSKETYKTDNEAKNQRLLQLKALLKKESKIVGLAYFNVDYTNGLTEKLIGEADRSAINLEKGKVYKSIFELIKSSEKLENENQLLSLFNLKLINKDGIEHFVRSDFVKPIKDLLTIVDKNLSWDNNKIQFIENVNIKNIYKRFSDAQLQEIKNAAKKFILE